MLVFFFKQKTAYEMRISDWSSDVCSSDLDRQHGLEDGLHGQRDAGPEGDGRRATRLEAAPRIVHNGRHGRETLRLGDPRLRLAAAARPRGAVATRRPLGAAAEIGRAHV